jgi:uncharacterized protein YndB with AHSA1/START domain
MMQTYTFQIVIKRPVEDVFTRFLEGTDYPKWSKAWGPSQQMLGQWVVGSTISFIDHKEGGTKVLVEDIEPNTYIKSKHIAMIDKDNQELELTDDAMKRWIGSREDYFFESISPNKTSLTITMVMDEMFSDMANHGWPQALQDFKQLCEEA